jgi:hypothetical protein
MFPDKTHSTDMEKEFKSGVTGWCTKGTGKIANQVEKVDWSMQMDKSMMASGLRVIPMELVSTCEYQPAKVQMKTRSKKQWTILINMRANSKWEKNTALEPLLLQMVLFSLEPLKRKIWLAKANTQTSHSALHTKASGTMTKCRAKVSSLTETAEHTKETFKEITDTVKVLWPGLTVENTMVGGIKTIKIKKEPILLLMGRQRKESGEGWSHRTSLVAGCWLGSNDQNEKEKPWKIN